ncbi:MAG: hypothetical protein ACK52I_29510, partial [Pseudomonadota bacterium]
MITSKLTHDPKYEPKHWQDRSEVEIENLICAPIDTLAKFHPDQFKLESHFVIAAHSLFEAGLKETIKRLATQIPEEFIDILAPKQGQIQKATIEAVVALARSRAKQHASFEGIDHALQIVVDKISPLRNRFAHGFKNISISISELSGELGQPSLNSTLIWSAVLNSMR